MDRRLSLENVTLNPANLPAVSVRFFARRPNWAQTRTPVALASGRPDHEWYSAAEPSGRRVRAACGVNGRAPS